MAPFELGVASFDPTADRVLLWTHVDGGGAVQWVIGRDPDITDVAASGSIDADPESGTATVDVAGLEPSTPYWYRFEAAGQRSLVGRTRTLPSGPNDRLRLAVVCCARYSQSTFAVYRAIAGSDVDLVLHVGDYVYEDAKHGLPGREPDPPHDAVTLDDYRRRHVQHRRDRDLQLAHAAHPFVVVWDDHDLADNACAVGAKSHDERRHGPWADRLRAALLAHQEFVPKRLVDPADPASAWRSFDAGCMRLVCTETRASGRDRQAGLDGAAPADDPDRSLLGDAQRSWLLPMLGDPQPAWTAMVSGTVVSELEIRSPEELDRVLPEKYAVVDGCGVNTDQWDGYQVERSRVAAAMAERAAAGRPNVVLSGDIHSAWALEGPVGPAGAPVAVEVVCPPAATTPLGSLLPAGLGRVLAAALRRDVDGVRWLDVDHHGFVTLDVAPERLAATFWWVDPAGDGRPVRGSAWQAFASRPGRWSEVDVDDLGDLGPVRRHRWYRIVKRLRGTLRRRAERRRRG